ncbi:MAG: hypothetical protein JWR85_2826 [Marmoricola sp.]|nr:hypothetical protein [Marmoricola sp.]
MARRQPAHYRLRVVRARAERFVEWSRRRFPTRLLPLLVRVRFLVAWSLPSVRADARVQMRFLLEHTQPDADLDAVARAYVKRMIWRGEMRWHPESVTLQRVVGFEHLVAARDLGRGVILNFMHHGYYEGFCPPLATRGVTSYMVGYAHIFGDGAPGWLRQNLRVSSTGGNTPISVGIGTQGIVDLLNEGHVVTLASDVPGRTPVTFAGRELMGSFGAARIAATTGSPVVLMTSEIDDHGTFIRIHDPLHPAAFDSPRELLDEMLARHERVVLKWPEGVDVPLSRWGTPERRAAG